MLFKEYPTIEYVLNNKPITLVDIFKNITFTNTENNKAFLEYLIQDGETPEIVSAKFYGDTSLSWLILLCNNIADIQNEWFQDSATFQRKSTRDFGGDALYISALPDIQQGDIMVKVTTTVGNEATVLDTGTYRVIDSFDPRFRVARGITGAGTFAANNTVLFARQNPADGTVSPISFLNDELNPETVNFTTLYRTEKYENTVDYFYDANNVVVDPYRRYNLLTNTVIANSIYTDPAETSNYNFASTILYRYISGATLPNTIVKRSLSKTAIEDHYKQQKIKLLKPEYLKPVLNAISNMLEENEVGRIFRIEL